MIWNLFAIFAIFFILTVDNSNANESQTFPYIRKCIPNLRLQFASLDTSAGTSLAVHAEDHFDAFEYTMNPINRFGYNNHFQGIQRLPDGKHFVVSGGDQRNHEAILAVGRIHHAVNYPNLMGEPWKSNIHSGFFGISSVPSEDSIINVIDVTSGKNWHAGGLDLLGNLLVVPVEEFNKTDSSDVFFYDFTDPTSPKKLDVSIHREDRSAGAAGIYQLPDGRYFLVLTHGSGQDAYLSRTQNILDGFDPNYFRWEVASLRDAPGDHSFGGSSNNLVSDCETNQIFMMSFDNRGRASPVLDGANWIYLYEVEGFQFDQPLLKQLNVKFVDQALVRTSNGLWSQKFNFAAGAGIYITPKKSLNILSCAHFRESLGFAPWTRILRIMQFAN